MKNPIKPTLKTEIIPLFFVLVSVITSFIFYSKFPNRVIVHWNFTGEANGWAGKGFAAFFFPCIIALTYFALLFLPITDPKKDRYEEFRRIYHKFKIIFIAFFTAIYLIASLKNIGFNFNMGIVIPELIGIMFIIIGNYLGKVRRNWFLGIKTPWTLSSDIVWNKTNRFGGKIIMIIGGLMIMIGFFQTRLIAIYLMALYIALFSSIFIYSYIIYLKEQKQNK